MRYILLFAILHAAGLGMAQSQEYTTDTVIAVEPPPPAERAGGVFSSITQTGPVEVQKVPSAKVEELKGDDAYWYANQAPEKKKKQEAQQQPKSSKGLLDAGWFRNLLWIIILCSFIGVVIWYLASSNINLFQKGSKKIVENEVEEEITDDIFSINYEREIEKAADAKNYRLAIRLWYLKTLKELSDRNIIDYRNEKTDSEYVNSLNGSRYYKDFFRLTRNFEYTWYGQFNLSAEAYNMMQTDFITFKNSLS
ncbi:MAG: hypothetical protein EOO10_10100 [Chitinophagaceae bacterium]|nr:MAG: hypothetical protein EOO10_10100 [Chitinophagaceae bacterium]